MENQTQTKPVEVTENKMGTMPVGKLLFTLSLPMVISMLVQALYNIVDSVFVAMINEDAFTAVSLAFPIQNLMIACSVGVGVGINALLSRKLGEKDMKAVQKVASNGLLIVTAIYAIFLVFGLFFTETFFASQTENLQIIEYGKEYLLYITVFSLGFIVEVTFERLLLSTGKTLFSMISQTTGAIVNIILDPIFIFVFDMGVVGAAIATLIGQFVAAGIAMFLHFKYNKEVHISYRNFKISFRTIRKILSVGIPSALMGAVGSVMTYGMNLILGTFSDTAMSVFGAYFKLQSFVFMPVFGLNNGMVPIIAYNYGAKRPDRISKTIKLSIVGAVGVMALGFALFQIFPHVLLGFFNPSEMMLALGVPALRTISICFLFAGYCIVIGSVFQALGHGISSMSVSMARQLLVLLPVAFILSRVIGLSAVWWAFPTAELASVTISTLLFIRIWKKEIRPLYNVK